jgi:Phosphate-selective porin O and P
MSRPLAALAMLLLAASTLAQSAPPDDNPSWKIGALLFADYTYADATSTGAFNVSRAYINVTGQLNHWIGYRITPDIARETGSGSSLNGSEDFRLKYAYAQFSLDDWTTKGSWVRFGVTQTPLIDYEETLYRYRFEGPTYTDREGFLTASDAGIAGHWSFPGNYGDVHAGYYNGEGYNHIETNNEKALQVRATVRPLPASAMLKGLRVTGFYDDDHYVRGAQRTRAVGQVTYESARVNAGLDTLRAHDRDANARGWSVWVNPKLVRGWELLLRHDDTRPDTRSSTTRKRDIAGIAYWFQHLKNVSSAVMADYDSTKTTARPSDARYGLKLLISF